MAIKNIHGKLEGVCLVVDPCMAQKKFLDKVRQALKGGISIVQVWNHWPEGMAQYDREQFVAYICDMASTYEIPVLINDVWEMLKTTPLAGVHFGHIPEQFDQIKEEVSRDFIAGITCGNKLEVIKWADKHNFDYASFCAMFPSPSVDSCEIVEAKTVHKAREITGMPLFVSGGISPERMKELNGLDIDGIAVISGIMKDEDPKARVQQYREQLEKH
ncbi:MAG: thiamine phosphate synthase [Balneolaceae bacterium]|nr:thiamine phosphate synthase [Balneolaceae bacterium]